MPGEQTNQGQVAASADELMGALDATRAAKGYSKAELARRGRLPVETVRRLLTVKEGNPTLATVLGMLKPMGLGLQLAELPAASEEVSLDPDTLRAWLARYGAPLFGASTTTRRVPPRLEYVLAEGLRLARADASVALSLPVALFSMRRRLDMAELRRLAEDRNEGRTLGFFLELTAELSGDASLARAARPLRPPRKRQRASQFFKVRSRRERDLAELKTPDVARRWGFKMNLSKDSFESIFRKAATLQS